MKYTFIFVIFCCCSLQSIPHSNPCNRSRVSPTVGNVFRIAFRIVGECSWISGISCKRHFVATISFSETKTNHKVQNQAVKRAGNHSHVFSGQKLLQWHKECAPAHCHGKSTNPGSATVLDVFGRLAPSNVAEPPLAMTDNHLARRYNS
jgi:hypothetical protein